MSINSAIPTGVGPGKGRQIMKQLQAKGVTKQDVKNYLASKGFTSREQVMQARQNGERPLTGLLQQHCITPPKLDQKA